MPDLTDQELAQKLSPLSYRGILEEIFRVYPVKCVDMQNLDHRKLDECVEILKSSSAKRNQTVLELIRLIRAASAGEPQNSPVIERIKEILRESPEDSLSLKELAQRVGISEYYMMHLFRKTVRMTVADYRTKLKLDDAREQLKNSDQSVSAIAGECGFASAAYFSRVFRRKIAVSPTEYRRIVKNTKRDNAVLARADDSDLVLYSMLEHVPLLGDLDPDSLSLHPAVKTYEVFHPDREFTFLHEAAIIEYHGKLFAAWYNCPRLELKERCPIRFCTSSDEGKSWTKPKTVADDPEGKILYCPPVFGIDDGVLYLFLNQMVGPDRIHSLDLYRYDEASDSFVFLWSRPIPFKLNTNVYKMENGKLLLPGRVAEMDGFPVTPAALISDSGKIDAPWRLVKLQPDGRLPDGSSHVNPELSAILEGETCTIFSRNDKRNVPLLYRSRDFGESWEGPFSHDIPFADSKIYSGTLSDGRRFVIGNLDHARSKLALFLSEKGKLSFTEGVLLQDGFSSQFGYGRAWHYPAAWEYNGKLFVICTVSLDSDTNRGAVVCVVDLRKI